MFLFASTASTCFAIFALVIAFVAIALNVIATSER